MSKRPDFKTVEAGRPDFETSEKWHFTKAPHPDWKVGSGATSDEWKGKKMVEIDPYGEGRASVDNYKLLISGIVPRPIGFLSTLSEDGKTANLAPMSYTNLANHDPPIFTVGISGGTGKLKDTMKNLLATKECTLNIISEWFIEAANYTSIDAPYGVSEWPLTGLTKAPSSHVKPPRVAESAFSVEAKVIGTHEWKSPSTGKVTGTMAILQGINFHVREDAVNQERNLIDIDVLKPMSRLGGIGYGRVTRGFELPRPNWAVEKEKEEVKEAVEKADDVDKSKV